jgi:hypothetical protein
LLSTLELGLARTQKASAASCVLGTSMDTVGLFALAQARRIQTPWYPTSKRHANPEVGS